LHRKLSFRGNSATWGVQARVHLSSYILAPSAERDDMLDLGLLCGLLDFQRLRSDVAWAVATMSGFHDEPRADSSTALPPGTIHDLDRFTAVDPDYAAPGAAPLIGDFCSQPPPPLRAVPGAPGTRRYELVEGPVGKTAAVTCVTGLIRRGAAPRYRSTADQFGEVMVTLTTPVEMAILDLLVHRSMMESMPPSAHLYSLLPGGPVYPRAGRDHGLLPMSERVSELGSGLGVPDIVTPEVPRYTQMVRRMLAAGGWSLGDFVGYRLRIKFPPIPTLAVLRFGLPAAPAQVVTIPALARAKT
jgi:hypothetical protein